VVGWLEEMVQLGNRFPSDFLNFINVTVVTQLLSGGLRGLLMQQKITSN